MLAVVPTGCGNNATETTNEDKKVSSEQKLEANAESDFTWYENEESDSIIPKGGIVISGYVGTDTEVVIPESINGKAVVAIDECAFSPYTKDEIEGTEYDEGYNFFNDILGLDVGSDLGTSYLDEDIAVYMKDHEKKSRITSVHIPDSIKCIGQYAFFFCDSLVEISTYGDSKDAIYVSHNTFECCSDLKVIDFPIGLNKNYSKFTLNESDIFNYSSSIEEISFEGIGECELPLQVLLEYANPKKIVITGDVTSVKGGVYQYAGGMGIVCYTGNALKNCEIYIPDSVTEIELGLFINEDSDYVEDMINDETTDYSFEDVVTINPNITIITPAGSYAEEFAKEYGIPYKNE